MSQSAASSARGGSCVSTTPDTRLRGRWLIVARVGWLVVVILALALFVGSLRTFSQWALCTPVDPLVCARICHPSSACSLSACQFAPRRD
jgi:hypothetical protein